MKNFIEDPKGYTAAAIKGALVQGVFTHFADSLSKERAAFVDKFPDVASVHKDPVLQRS